jgi:ATP-grasp domain, R2K clade family 3
LPGWYETCRDLTIPTTFAREDSDFSAILPPLSWQKYFVKDFVKSLTTARGSVADTIEEVYAVVKLLRQYRGQVEGGVCVREFIALRPGTEERYFVLDGTAHGRHGSVPEIVGEVARRIASPFFSVDVAEREQGGLVVVELGDGQVSDRKNWPASRLAELLNAA